MITVDFIGLLISACLIGIRYPFSLCLAVVVHEVGRVVMAVFLDSRIENVVVAGVFSATTVSESTSGFKLFIITIGGSIANYIVSSTIGGVEWEKTSVLANPLSVLRYPAAVIQLRFALVSLGISLMRLF